MSRIKRLLRNGSKQRINIRYNLVFERIQFVSGQRGAYENAVY